VAERPGGLLLLAPGSTGSVPHDRRRVAFRWAVASGDACRSIKNEWLTRRHEGAKKNQNATGTSSADGAVAGVAPGQMGRSAECGVMSAEWGWLRIERRVGVTAAYHGRRSDGWTSILRSFGVLFLQTARFRQVFLCIGTRAFGLRLHRCASVPLWWICSSQPPCSLRPATDRWRWLIRPGPGRVAGSGVRRCRECCGRRVRWRN
jgi:hypothetical protein